MLFKLVHFKIGWFQIKMMKIINSAILQIPFMHTFELDFKPSKKKYLTVFMSLRR